MTNKNYNGKQWLIITAIKEYWPNKKNIVLLGEWCRFENEKYDASLDYKLVKWGIDLEGGGGAGQATGLVEAGGKLRLMQRVH